MLRCLILPRITLIVFRECRKTKLAGNGWITDTSRIWDLENFGIFKTSNFSWITYMYQGAPVAVKSLYVGDREGMFY